MTIFRKKLTNGIFKLEKHHLTSRDMPAIPPLAFNEKIH